MVFEFHGFTIQLDGVVVLSKHVGKLIHNAAFNTYKMMFGRLTCKGYFHPVHAQIKQLIQPENDATFQRGR